MNSPYSAYKFLLQSYLVISLSFFFFPSPQSMGSPLIWLLCTFFFFVVALAVLRTKLLKSDCIWLYPSCCDPICDFLRFFIRHPLSAMNATFLSSKYRSVSSNFVFNKVVGYVGLPLDWNANTIVPWRSPLPSPLFSEASKLWYQKWDHITIQSITLSTKYDACSSYCVCSLTCLAPLALHLSVT